MAANVPPKIVNKVWYLDDVSSEFIRKNSSYVHANVRDLKFTFIFKLLFKEKKD